MLWNDKTIFKSLKMHRVLGYWTVYCTQSGGSIFFKNTKVTCLLLYNLGGGGGGGGGAGEGWVSIFSPKSQKYVQMCIHVCTFVT